LIGGSEEASSKPFRAVLDTSVRLSEHRHWLWLLARLDYYEAVWSTFIVAELVRIRVEHSISHQVARAMYRQRINDLIHLLSDQLLLVNYRQVTVAGLIPDPDDEPILATALAAGADCIVSLNTRDFPLAGQVVGVQFLTPPVFLTELIRRHPNADPGKRAGQAGRQLP